jgi:hypothetical protein
MFFHDAFLFFGLPHWSILAWFEHSSLYAVVISYQAPANDTLKHYENKRLGKEGYFETLEEIVVTFLVDGGQRYQSRLFNPAFVRKNGLLVPSWMT